MFIEFSSGERVTAGGKGTCGLVDHAFSSNRPAGIIAGLSLHILHQALTFLGVMGAEPGAAPLSTLLAQWTGQWAAIQKHARFRGGGAWLVCEKRFSGIVNESLE